MSTTEPGLALLADLRESPLSVDEVIDAVRHPSCGGLVVFIGLVRDHDSGHSVRELDYTAHPSALAELERVCREVAGAHPGTRLASVHRVGDLTVGDLAVVVAAAAAHRGEAFTAARALIDTLKATVPIWKHQLYADGATSWVGLP